VAIVGAGDTAAEEALYLSKLATNVHMLIRRDQMRASKIMQERVQRTPNIKVHWNSETDEILGETKVEGIRVKNVKTGEKKDIPVAGFFVAIGHQPNSEILRDGSTWTKPGTYKRCRVPAKQMWKEFLLRAMCRIRFTGRL
jgi:thioredoxin reductase (NADPH)